MTLGGGTNVATTSGGTFEPETTDTVDLNGTH